MRPPVLIYSTRFLFPDIRAWINLSLAGLQETFYPLANPFGRPLRMPTTFRNAIVKNR